jgi:hypothetical protein
MKTDIKQFVLTFFLASCITACASNPADPAPATRGASAAAPANLTPEQVVRFLDKDGDGKVGRGEYLTFQGTRFPIFDTDNDGMLSLDEFRDAQPGQRAKSNAGRTYNMFHRGEGGMNETEFLAFHSFVFANFVDSDKDGFMSGEEWARLVQD